MAKRGEREEELMVRGSLITLSRRCGKENCHCREGEPHQTPALSYSVRGHTAMLTLREEDVPRVRAALERYKRAKADLEAAALSGIERLRAERYGGGGA